MKTNPNLKYSKEHEWIKIEKNIATIGLTNFAQKHLLDIVFVKLPKRGEQTTKGKKIAIVESTKAISDIIAPVSGEITVIKENLKENPELINKDPYNLGWILKIKIKDIDETKDLMSEEEYGNFHKKCSDDK